MRVYSRVDQYLLDNTFHHVLQLMCVHDYVNNDQYVAFH